MPPVNIPQEVYDSVSVRVDASDFESVDEYVTFVLGEVLAQVGHERPAGDEEVIHDRLRELGYID